MLVALAASMILSAEPAGGSVSLSSDKGASASASASAAKPEDKWILRHRPKDHDLTFGIFAGAFIPGDLKLRHDTVAPSDYAPAAFDVGLRLGYFPIRFFGLEGEAAFMPTNYRGNGALMYAVRAHGVLQAGWWRIVPFALLGGGLLGIASASDVAGLDTDPALHVGGGLKIHATKRVTIRLEGRDVVSSAESGGVSHSPEALVSIGFRFGAKPKPKPEPPPPDEDKDGVADADDWCPKEPGPKENKGCPWGDGDCDGVHDGEDKCPDEAGVEPEGCAPPDTDGDGFVGEADKCPDEAGIAPDGCPDPDPDGDKIEGEADKCPDEPETANGFDDEDGCPDEIPAAVKNFTGVIAGITFATGTAKVRPSSTSTLEEAARTLKEYDHLKLEIIGHTDNRGSRSSNVALSLKRAEAVKAFLVEQGVEGSRLKTRGAGPDEPRESNATRDGRAQNRRIEFKLVE